MILTDRLLGETMIRMVPTPKLPETGFECSLGLRDPTSNASLIDFDLDLLPSTDPHFDLPIASPLTPDNSFVDSCLSPASPSDQTCISSPVLGSEVDLSPTMFSPGAVSSHFTDHKSAKPNNDNSTAHFSRGIGPLRHVPTASPMSLPPSSPYSPASRQTNRFSSTDSASGSACGFSIQDSLNELADIQRETYGRLPGTSGQIKVEAPGHVKMEDGFGPIVETETPLLKRALEDSTTYFARRQAQDVHMDGVDDMDGPKLDSDLCLRMAMDHMKEEIMTQSARLNIDTNPKKWTKNDVAIWLNQTMTDLKIPAEVCSATLQWASNYDGSGFVKLAKEDFRMRILQGGDQVHTALDMWKAAAVYGPEDEEVEQRRQLTQQPRYAARSRDEEFDINYVLDVLESGDGSERPPPPAYSEVPARPQTFGESMPPIEQLLQHPPPPYPMCDMTPSSTRDDLTDEDEADIDPPCLSSGQRPASGPMRSSSTSSNIHLWQFVKELLNQPHAHSCCIQWINREEGIFKIVDSVRVAELWGKRKNRPAMNFDKLSRSLRQYYKKGIMQKTTKRERLVYQFCAPYHH